MKTCAHTISCCVYNGNIQLLSHTHIHTLTHTDSYRWSKSRLVLGRAALAIVDWPWKHQVWQTLTNTQISMYVNTLNITTTLTNPNARKVPWSGRGKGEWLSKVPTQCLSKYSNTHIHHKYQHFSIHLTHAQTFEHITCKHVSRIAMPLHTNADCLFLLIMPRHVITQDVQHEQEKHEQTYCMPLSKKGRDYS